MNVCTENLKVILECVESFNKNLNKQKHGNFYFIFSTELFEPRREKNGFLHMRKQRRRSASRYLCFRYTDSTIPLLPKSEISSL